MTSRTLAEWLRRLESIHPREVELGLDRVGAVAGTMGLLPVAVPVVTVAGTNGKGSTVALLEALLAADGRTVGAFTSPHLLRFNERIRFAGKEVGDADIVEAFDAIDAARGDVSLTYFEFSTLAALYIFRRLGADTLVLEVGLGGRLDAVNLVNPAVSVITSIDLDHQDWLGESRDLIAVEKAGILRPGVPVIVADADPPPSLRRCIDRVGASPALFLGDELAVLREASGWRVRVRDVSGAERQMAGIPDGPLLPENVCAAVQAALLLGASVDEPRLAELVQNAAPLARRQSLSFEGLSCVIDVAHNPAAVRRLVEYLAREAVPGRSLAVFSAMGDKDLPGMIAAAAGAFDAWFIADQPGNPRAAPASRIASLLREAGLGPVSESRNLRQAFARARALSGPADRVVVFGSFFTVAAVLPILQRHRAMEVAASE